MSQLMGHPNILELKGISSQSNPIYIATEYLPTHGDLQQYLFEARKALKTKDVIRILIEIATGIHFIIQKGFAHQVISIFKPLLMREAPV